MVFVLRNNDKDCGPGTLGRLLWRGAWMAQVVLWGLLAWVVLHYWLVEVPAVNGYHTAGLIKGFDGLAGIVASAEPDWESVSSIQGAPGSSRYTRLQGDVVFKVWKNLDEFPAWNAGMAKLQYSKGGLSWVRRYTASSPARQVLDSGSGTRIPVVFSWSDGRSTPAADR